MTYDEEMNLNMKNAIAIARNGKETIFVTDMYECGYAINAKIDGKWDYSDGYSAVEVMKKFTALARKYNVKTCLVYTEWLDIDYLKGIDEARARYAEEEAYADACMASEYGDDSLMKRYNRTHGIEDEYSPSNPWDAPGMSVSDFVTGVI